MVQRLQKYLAFFFWVDFRSGFKVTVCCYGPHPSICMESYFSFNAFSFHILPSLHAFYYCSLLIRNKNDQHDASCILHGATHL